jgi:uncharacterized membrane protein YkvA (DUF1232 family)
MSLPPKATPTGLAQIIQTFYLSIKLFFSPKVPMWVKTVPLLALAYVIFPFDFLPDFFPGIGQLDDLTVLLVFMWAFLQLCPAEVVRDVRGDGNVVDASYKVVKDDAPPAAPPDQIAPPSQTR